MKSRVIILFTTLLFLSPLKVNASGWYFFVSDSVSARKETAANESQCERNRSAFIKGNPGWYVGSCLPD